MVDFEVVYIYGSNKDMVLVSKVYAVEQNNFLVADGWGKFRWVPMENCTEIGAWEADHGKLIPDDEEESTEPATA